MAAHLAYAGGCTWDPKAASKVTPRKFQQIFDGERTYPGNTPREQRDAWEREQDEIERLRQQNGHG